MREVAKKRKNFLPTLLVALFFWIGWFLVFFKIPPETIFSYLAFYFSLFLAIFLSLALIFGNSRRGFFLSFGLICFLFLRQMKLASILNIVLLISLLASLEIYFSRRR